MNIENVLLRITSNVNKLNFEWICRFYCANENCVNPRHLDIKATNFENNTK